MRSKYRVRVEGTPGPFPFHFVGLEPERQNYDWPVPIRGIGFVVSNYCPAACRHCYNNSSPKGKDMLPPEFIVTFCEDARRSGCPVESVGLSGGETFSYPHIMELINSLSQRGFSVSLNSSGVDVTFDIIDSASDAGLKKIVWSYDPYHNPFISKLDILSLIQYSCKKIPNVDVKISVVSKLVADELISQIDDFVDSEITIVVQPVIPVGRAQKFNEFSSYDTDYFPKSNSCSHEFQTICVNYDRSVLSCCSVGASVETHKIGDILENFQSILGRRLENEAFQKLNSNDDFSQRSLSPVGSDEHKCTKCSYRISEFQNKYLV